MPILKPIEKIKENQTLNSLIQTYNLTSHDNVEKRKDLLLEMGKLMSEQSMQKTGEWKNDFAAHLNFYELPDPFSPKVSPIRYKEALQSITPEQNESIDFRPGA